MNKYTAISLAALIVLVVFAADTVSAADSASSNNSTCNVVGINYKCESWSDEQYPVIDLFGEKNVPLFNASENIWNSHVNKLARLILDSNETYTLKNGENLDLGNGYALEVKQIDIDSEKVWLEFTKDGKYVADQNISVNTDPLFNASENIWNSHVNKLARLVLDSNETYTLEACEKIDLGHGYALKVKQIDIDNEKVWLELTNDGKHVADKKIPVNTDNNNTWTVTLDNIQGENNIVVMKVHVKQLFVGTEKSIVWIDGIWLLDYANAKTINTGDQVGEYTLTETISGVDESNLGSLVFEKTPVDNCSASSNSGKGVTKFADKSTKPSTSWYQDFCIFAAMKGK